MRIEFVVARIRGHLKVNRLSDFHLIELVADIGVVAYKLLHNHGLANVAVTVQQHARHPPAGRMIQQVLHAGQRLVATGIGDPLGGIQPGHTLIN